MKEELLAKSSIIINAPTSKVWDALVNQSMIKQYMFGTDVISKWKEGSAIVWRGIWNDKSYEDKGVILKIVPERLLQYTHLSPLTGVLDIPENYHTVTYQVLREGEKTHVLLTQ